MSQMIRQGYGSIYNLEGYGSNDAMMLGFNMYGTGKRAVTHFTQALAKESEECKTGVLVAKILKNKKNNVHIQWLTTAKVMRKFLTAGFNKHDFFS